MTDTQTFSQAVVESQKDAELTPQEYQLRMLLAIHAGGPHLYTDDGEMSCSAEFPMIDFRRDEPDVIESKLRERGSKRWARTVLMPMDRVGPGLPQCVEACLATMLAIPLWKVGDLSKGARADSSDHSLRTILWSRVDEFMKLYSFHMHTAMGKNYTFEGLALAVGSTEARDFHAVVLKGGELYHDPLPGGVGLKKVDAVKMLLPLDPIQRQYVPAQFFPPQKAKFSS